jgi:hypothetical protein
MAYPDLVPNADYGTVFPWDNPEALAEDLTEVALEWKWVNLVPFWSRVQKLPATNPEYHMTGTSRRPDTVTVTVAAVATDTVLTVADPTYILNGDTLELRFADNTVEQLEVIADPNEAAAQITVKRGDAFTTAGAIPANTQLYLISNTRTGGEDNQKGIAPRAWKRTNWIETIQHPVEVSGILQDTTAYRSGSIAPGAATPLDAFRMRGLNDWVLDADRAIVYQRGMAPTDSNTKRAKTKGIRQICQDAGSYINQPTNYAAFTIEDFTREISEIPAGFGGAPNVYFISNDWISAFARWKMPLVKIDMGETAFNVRIDAYESNAANGIFVHAPRLRRGTIFATNEEDLMIRFMRMPTWYLRGKLGDSWRGDIVGRIGVQVNNAEQSRFCEGITGFAAA